MEPTEHDKQSWQRWTLLVFATVLASALAITGWLNFRALGAAAIELEEGEAHTLLDSLRASMRSPGQPPSEQDLATWLEGKRDNGATFALFDDGRLRFEVGTRRPEPLSNGALAPAPTIERYADVVRFSARTPRPPRRPRGHRAPPPRPGAGPPVGMIVVEFVPLRVNGLLARARNNLVINLVAAVLILVLAGVGFRWMRQRSRADARHRLEAHLVELGQTSAVLAHELRNPLASLKGHAQLLLESSQQDTRTAAKAERIVGEAQRLERLTDGLLDFVRVGAIECAPCDPAEIVRHSADDVAASAGDDVSFEVRLDAAPPSWSLDADRFRQVATNLIRNAVDAAGPSGTVIAELTGPADELVLEVTDDGPGVAADARETIFRPFHTTKTRGTGLGLAISRRLVQLHGGTLVVVDAPGGGARFVARFPSKS